jgi:hypothetical protein
VIVVVFLVPVCHPAAIRRDLLSGDCPRIVVE